MPAMARDHAEDLISSSDKFSISKELPGGRWLIRYEEEGGKKKKGKCVYYAILYLDFEGEWAMKWVSSLKALPKAIDDLMEEITEEEDRNSKFISAISRNLQR